MHHQAFHPPKTPLSPRINSPPSRILPSNAFCTATADGESLSLINLGGLNSPAAVKEKILARLRIPDDEYFDCVFHLTHINGGEGRRISDNELWDVCARSGDGRAGVTIFVKRSINFDPDPDFGGASSAARLRSAADDLRSLRSAESHHPPIPPSQSMQQSYTEPRHRPNLPSPINSSSSIPFMRSPVPPHQNPNRHPPTPPVDPRVHPQYATVPPSSGYHNIYIQSQYQSQPPPTIRTQTALPAHQMQSFSPIPPRQMMSKSVGNLHGQYVQDSRPPLPNSGPNPQYRQHDNSQQSMGHPGAYGSRQPPQQPPYPQPPPRQQQTSPRPPNYNPPPSANQAYPSFDPRVMRAPPSATSSSSRSGQPSSATTSNYSPYPSHIPPRSIPTNIPSPSTQFWPGPPPHRLTNDRPNRPPEIPGRLTLRPGETLQHSGRRASEGQQETMAMNSALSRSPPIAAHMRAADPAQEARKRSQANFEAEPGRYATESVPAPRREASSNEVRNPIDRRPSNERERSREAALRKRMEGAPPPKVITNGTVGREGESVSGNGMNGPASASARSSGSSFASNSSTQSFPRRKSAPSDEVYGGMTDDSGSLRTASSTRSSATGPLTPLTPLTDYLSPVLPSTKSPSPAALDGLGIEEAQSMPLETNFGDEEDDTGTWQAGKVPSPYVDSFDDDVEDEGAGTWLVTPNRTPKDIPSTPSTATLPLKIEGITLKDEPSSRSPTTERNRKEQRPSLRLTIDNTSEIADAAAVTPRSNGRRSADSDQSTLASTRRMDRARLSPSAAAVVPTPTRPGSLSSVVVGPPPMIRRTSFARREADSEWAFRPPIETVLENLDEYFPEHDLDQPIVDANTPPTPMRSPANSSPARKDAVASETARQGAVTALRNKKSIRKVAQDRKRNLQMQRMSTNVEEAAVPDPSLLRRKSTKLWGNRVEEVTPEQAKLMATVVHAAPDDDPENFSFKWVKGELIGRGTYGQVYLAMNVTTGDMLAVKQVELPKTRSDKDDLRQQGMVFSLKAEIELLKDLDHSKIVQYLGFEETVTHLSIFLEYVPGGSVGRIVRKHGKFEENVTKSFTRQILEGLEYLHSLGILHRDLKADNILCDHVGNCKISDFGTSKKSNDIYNNDANMSMQGSIFWMAPEVVQNWKKGYSAKADIWSLGCICLEMWAGRRPWSDEEAIQAMFKLGAERLAPPIPADVVLTDSSSHFLSECFQIDPELRPTASQLRRHIFLEIDPRWDFQSSSLNRAIASSRSAEE